eukprot:scaffold2697_cov79-Skeletonema_marinoi.AAC.1
MEAAASMCSHGGDHLPASNNGIAAGASSAAAAAGSSFVSADPNPEDFSIDAFHCQTKLQRLYAERYGDFILGDGTHGMSKRKGVITIRRTIVYSSNADNSKVFDVWAAFAEQYPNVKRSHFRVKKNVTWDELLNTDNCGFDDVYAFVDRADANVKIPEEVIAYNEVIESLTISELGGR